MLTILLGGAAGAAIAYAAGASGGRLLAGAAVGAAASVAAGVVLGRRTDPADAALDAPGALGGGTFGGLAAPATPAAGRAPQLGSIAFGLPGQQGRAAAAHALTPGERAVAKYTGLVNSFTSRPDLAPGGLAPVLQTRTLPGFGVAAGTPYRR